MNTKISMVLLTSILLISLVTALPSSGSHLLKKQKPSLITSKSIVTPPLVQSMAPKKKITNSARQPKKQIRVQRAQNLQGLCNSNNNFCDLGDINRDSDLTQADYNITDFFFAQGESCNAQNSFCNNSDTDFTGIVDADDYFKIDKAFGTYKPFNPLA
ncbi:MAG TPA: hypothetical protein VJK51_04535 [Candidatus Nanoarchaeia archaeon]|nr:hypothetical protein [Candidatus Nanoarchaeia archaeon]